MFASKVTTWKLNGKRIREGNCIDYYERDWRNRMGMKNEVVHVKEEEICFCIEVEMGIVWCRLPFIWESTISNI